MDVDRSLDEIVAAKKANRNKKPRGAGAKGAAAGGKPVVPQGARAPQQQRAQQQQQPRGGQQQQQQNARQAGAGLGQIVGDKIVVSGLPADVSEQQVRELFTTTIGPLRSASLSYDSKGQSKGIATIEFKKAADATKAYEQYNKRLIDGKKPMKVEIIVDPSRVPAQPLSSRLGGAPKAASATIAAAGGSARQARNAPAGGAAGAGAAKQQQRKKAPKPKQVKRPAATLESLDAEMADYQAAKSTAPAAAAPAAEAAVVV